MNELGLGLRLDNLLFFLVDFVIDRAHDIRVLLQKVLERLERCLRLLSGSTCCELDPADDNVGATRKS